MNFDGNEGELVIHVDLGNASPNVITQIVKKLEQADDISTEVE